MKRTLFASLLVASTSLTCVGISDSGQSLLVVAPVLDSIFVGDTAPARNVYIIDASGHQTGPGPVKWSINPQSVATIDSVTGKIVGVSKGTALVIATAAGVQSGAIVAVSRPVDLTLQMDTIFVMPGDTITVPLAIKLKTPGLYTLRFTPSPSPGTYTIDSLTGVVTAVGATGPVRYVARLKAGTDSVADTGAVAVLSLVDTAETGRFYMTAFGTAIRHQSGAAIASNYTRLNFKQAFQLADTVYAVTGSDTVYEKIIITLPDSVIATGVYEIDSISPAQATTQISQLNPFCQPKFPWALWYSVKPSLIRTYSHGTSSSAVAGHISVTQLDSVPGGAIISGRYQFRAQRTDLYVDPLGLETVRGTFVAPLRTRPNTCGN